MLCGDAIPSKGGRARTALRAIPTDVAAAQRVPVGQLLLDAGILDATMLEAVLEAQRQTGMPLGRVIVAHGFASADDVATALADQYGRLIRAEFGLHAEDAPHAPRSTARAEELEALRTRYAAMEAELAARRQQIADLEAQLAAERAAAPAPTARTQPEDYPLLPPPPPPKEPRLGELLVSKGLVDRRQMDLAIFESRNTNTMLGRVLLQKGLIFEDDLARCLSEQWKMEFVSLVRVGVDRSAVRLLPKKIGLDLATIPVRYADSGVVVAFADPSDEDALAAVESFISPFTPVVSVLSDITMMWRHVHE